jgi:hypothetical protein
MSHLQTDIQTATRRSVIRRAVVAKVVSFPIVARACDERGAGARGAGGGAGVDHVGTRTQIGVRVQLLVSGTQIANVPKNKRDH